MITGNSGDKRDLVLNPLEQAFLQDETRGQIKTYVGPCVINQTGTDRPVKYEHATRTYSRCQLEQAVVKVPIASEGDYIVLENPAQRNEKPEEGNVKVSPALQVGRKINIPGPCIVPLWPGQNATVVKGHNLRSNQYLLVRIYNEEESKKNWALAVVKKATPEAAVTAENPQPQLPAPMVGATSENLNLSIGQLLIIRGTEVSFYIPPTGVEVVPDENGNYVREALTLERLTYCILVDEDGNKRYEKGPQVVFPKPTETFLSDSSGSRKFRAIELNPIQGLHIKVIAPYTDEPGTKHSEGTELFITGKDTAIYYPRVEHSIVQYGDQKKHFATAIPAGEGRYVMNRLTGEIRTEQGPKMLLPDPRSEVIIRRILSDKQCDLWYPGNAEAKTYNLRMREAFQDLPMARSGFVSEGEVQKSRQGKQLPAAQTAAATPPTAPKPAEHAAANAMMPDAFSRSNQYTQPRSITLDTKYEGVPAVTVWTGYAVMVVNKRGQRRVEQGPTTILLDYDDALEILELSTGKPKTTDRLERTVYLRVMNNKVSDIVEVETLDHVPVKVKLAYRVNFEGEPTKWFESENYVKLLCDHARSILKGRVQKIKIEDFYRNGVDVIRDIILGKAVDDAGRKGLIFTENGMHVTDVEVLEITIDNPEIDTLLKHAQHEVVSSNITISQLEKALEVTKRKEEINREQAEAEAATVERRQQLAVAAVNQELAVTLAKIQSELQAANQQKEAEGARQVVKDVSHKSELHRLREKMDQEREVEEGMLKLRTEELGAQADSVVKRFQAAQQGFSEALVSLGNQQTLQKVAKAMSVQNLIGGRNFSDVVGKLFDNTPVQSILETVVNRAAGLDNQTKKPAAPPKK